MTYSKCRVSDPKRLNSMSMDAYVRALFCKCYFSYSILNFYKHTPPHTNLLYGTTVNIGNFICIHSFTFPSQRKTETVVMKEGEREMDERKKILSGASQRRQDGVRDFNESVVD